MVAFSIRPCLEGGAEIEFEDRSSFCSLCLDGHEQLSIEFLDRRTDLVVCGLAAGNLLVAGENTPMTAINPKVPLSPGSDQPTTR